jgi:hypothetical protein
VGKVKSSMSLASLQNLLRCIYVCGVDVCV